jgi:hypothetical protein
MGREEEEEEDEIEEEEEYDSSEEEEEGIEKDGEKTEEEEEEGGSGGDDGIGDVKLVVWHGSTKQCVIVSREMLVGPFRADLAKITPVYAQNQNLYRNKIKGAFSRPGDGNDEFKLLDLLHGDRVIRVTTDKKSIRGGKGGKGGVGGAGGSARGGGGGGGGKGDGKGGSARGGAAKKRKTDSGAGTYKGHEVVTYEELATEDPWEDFNNYKIPLIAYFKKRNEWFPIKGIMETQDDERYWQVEWKDNDKSDIVKEAYELARDPSVKR